MEELKGGVGNKIKDVKEYWWCKEHRSGKGQWVFLKPEDPRKWISTSSISGGSNNPPNKGYRNKKLTLTKEFKDGLLATKDESDVQSLLYQFNINVHVND